MSLLEQDAEGERTVAICSERSATLKTLTKAVADLSKTVAETQKSLSRLEDFVMVSQAEMPRKFAEIAAAVMRDELARRN